MWNTGEASLLSGFLKILSCRRRSAGPLTLWLRNWRTRGSPDPIARFVILLGTGKPLTTLKPMKIKVLSAWNILRRKRSWISVPWRFAMKEPLRMSKHSWCLFPIVTAVLRWHYQRRIKSASLKAWRSCSGRLAVFLKKFVSTICLRQWRKWSLRRNRQFWRMVSSSSLRIMALRHRCATLEAEMKKAALKIKSAMFATTSFPPLRSWRTSQALMRHWRFN